MPSVTANMPLGNDTEFEVGKLVTEMMSAKNDGFFRLNYQFKSPGLKMKKTGKSVHFEIEANFPAKELRVIAYPLPANTSPRLLALSLIKQLIQLTTSANVWVKEYDNIEVNAAEVSKSGTNTSGPGTVKAPESGALAPNYSPDSSLFRLCWPLVDALMIGSMYPFQVRMIGCGEVAARMWKTELDESRMIGEGLYEITKEMCDPDVLGADNWSDLGNLMNGWEIRLQSRIAMLNYLKDLLSVSPVGGVMKIVDDDTEIVPLND